MRAKTDLFPVLVGFLLVVALAMCLGSCSSVIMNADYSARLDRTAAWSAEASARADGNNLSVDGMKAALRQDAAYWRAFQNARDGQETKP
ncbi:MAG: hypothetical protein IMZ55_06390 [Acidobacteria bacterium]|nr:hypothetical protein [Acidobacteriota bacterium]